MPELTINGSSKHYSDEDFPTLLSELIETLNLSNLSIIAEVDGEIIRKENFTTTNIKDGMKLELVKFVGGG